MIDRVDEVVEAMDKQAGYAEAVEETSMDVEVITALEDSEINIGKSIGKEAVAGLDEEILEEDDDDESLMSEDDRELEDDDSGNESNLDDDMEIDEDVSALVPIKLPTEAELNRLQSLFPEPEKYAVSYLRRLKPNGQSQCLAILNLPTYFVWMHVVLWIKKVANYKRNKMPKRILRTNEGGYQCFWLLFKNQGRAATFRGFTHDRQMKYRKRIKCEFAEMSAYNSYDGWTRTQGFQMGHDGSIQLSQLPLLD